jgi:hypothetical protein
MSTLSHRLCTISERTLHAGVQREVGTIARQVGSRPTSGAKPIGTKIASDTACVTVIMIDTGHFKQLTIFQGLTGALRAVVGSCSASSLGCSRYHPLPSGIFKFIRQKTDHSGFLGAQSIARIGKLLL